MTLSFLDKALYLLESRHFGNLPSRAGAHRQVPKFPFFASWRGATVGEFQDTLVPPSRTLLDCIVRQNMEGLLTNFAAPPGSYRITLPFAGSCGRYL